MSSDSSTSSPSAGEDLAVDDHLIAGLEGDHVVDARLADGATRASLAVAHDRRAVGAVEQREPVERPLGTELLHDADQGVRDEHDAEQCVLQRPDDEDQREHRT